MNEKWRKLITITKKNNMKNTNLSARIIYLTPEIAKELISKNVGNRPVKRKDLSRYIKDMQNGYWKENGEPIIVDINGQIKDGQHRLLACIESGHSYNVPLITGVHPDVMDTIDTGVNRTLNDVLKLNGFNYHSAAAALIKAIVSYNNKHKALSKKGSGHKGSMTNQVGLQFMQENTEMIYSIIKLSYPYYEKQSFKVFSTTQVSFYIYVLTNGDVSNPFIEDFVKELYGIVVQEGNAVSYVRRTAARAKENKTLLDGNYLLALVIRSWNSYVTGDPQVSFIKHSANKELPQVIQVN